MFTDVYCYPYTNAINTRLWGKEQQKGLLYWTSWCGVCYGENRIDWKFLMYNFSVTMAKCFDLKNTWNVLPMAMKSQLITFTDCNKLLRDLYVVKFMILRSDNVIYLYMIYQSALYFYFFWFIKKTLCKKCFFNYVSQQACQPYTVIILRSV